MAASLFGQTHSHCHTHGNHHGVNSGNSSSWMRHHHWLGVDGHKSHARKTVTHSAQAISKTLERHQATVTQQRQSQDVKKEVPVKEFLDLIMRLLKAHEVKMVLGLLNELVSTPMSQGFLNVSKDDLASVLHGLADSVRTDVIEGASDALMLFERYCSHWSAAHRSRHKKAVSPNGFDSSGRAIANAKAPLPQAAPAEPRSPRGAQTSESTPPWTPAAPLTNPNVQVKPPAHEPRRLLQSETSMASIEPCGEADGGQEFEDIPRNHSFSLSSSVGEPFRYGQSLNSMGSLDVSHICEMSPILSDGAAGDASRGTDAYTTECGGEQLPGETARRSLEGDEHDPPTPISKDEKEGSWNLNTIADPEFGDMSRVHTETRTEGECSVNSSVMPLSNGGGAVTTRSSAHTLKRRATVTQALLEQMTTRLSLRNENDFKHLLTNTNLVMKVNLRSTNTVDVLDETWLSMPSNCLIVHPNGTFRMSWDVCALFAIVNEAILVPLSVFFEMETPEIIMLLSTIFFGIDIALNLITGYFHDGMLIMKQKPIIFNYARGWFLLDVISTFPWYAVFQSSSSGAMLKFAKFGKMARVLRLLRIAKLNMLVTRIEEFLAGAVIAITLSLMKIVAFLGLLCHWCACIWGWLGDPGRCEGCIATPVDTCEPGGPCEAGIQGTPWRSRYAVSHFSLLDQYLLALRFAVGLVTGSETDIQPGFWAERTFVCLMTFCSFILCSTVISQIIVTFHKILQEQSEQLELMRNFKEFMSAGRVPFPLQAKVRRYLEFQFKSRKDLQMRRFDLLERLSPWLRAELLVHMNKPVLIQHPFFKQLPHTILAHICCLAESMTCAPGDILAEPGQNLGKMYFLVRGKLHIRFPEAWGEAKDGRKTAMPAAAQMEAQLQNADMDPDNAGFLLHPPGFVCASNLLKSEVHSYCITSAAHSEVVTISKRDLESLVTEFPSLQDFMDRGAQEVDLHKFQDSSLKDLQTIIRARSTRIADGSGRLDTVVSEDSLRHVS